MDISPTLYKILGITPPKTINDFEQMRIDDRSFAPTFVQADAQESNTRQFFDNNASRAI